MAGASPSDEEELRSGTWTVELADLQDAWALEDSSCRESDGTTTSAAAGPRADLGVDPGDTVRCQFKLTLLAPLPGTWQVQNKKGRLTCKGGFVQELAPLTERGRIKVRRGGDVLIGNGISGERSAPVLMTRTRDAPRRYRGTFRVSVGGSRFKFTLDVTMDNEKKLTGVFKASGTIRGQKCTISRPVTLRYLGR